MHWEEKDAHYIESDKHYRVSKGPEGAAGRYTAWPPGASTAKPSLGSAPTIKEAVQICEDHLTENGGKNGN